MNNEKPHFLARKFQDFQRQAAKLFVCPLCAEEPSFVSEQKLFDHATAAHRAVIGPSRDSRAYHEYLTTATSKTRQQHGRRLAPDPSPAMSKPSSNESMKLNFGDDAASRSPSRRPDAVPGPRASVDKKLEDLTKLSLNPGPELPTADFRDTNRTPSPLSNPLKRAAAAEGGVLDHSSGHGESPVQPRNRRAKALSGGSFVPKDPEFDRKPSVAKDSHVLNERSGGQKRLFDPNTDKPAFGSNQRKFGKADGTPASRRVYDPRSHLFRTKKLSGGDIDHDRKSSARPHFPAIIEKSAIDPHCPAEPPSDQDHLVDHSDSDTNDEPVPELLLQPETRPISHEQLVVEVKGIYAGLVMVEAKCMDIDDKQSLAALEKDPSKQTKLKPEQWQALIALHKTLLHEHHDFFLASQHPSASPALSRLAAKYSMPARMWRHGIHAFLEVLRHRLPESLDHMLAFIYIAYSMMALLYETVPTFEDTWIECLGDLGRYRMAIEDDDIRDREVWSGVARFWYSMAADKSPNVGRLYHHLAILARPYTLEQLSLYTRSLTCIVPFESAKGSIMTLFSPILEGKESGYHRTSSMETVFIKAHGILFTGGSMQDFLACLERLRGGLIDNYIGRVTGKFKQQGVFAALANISALFEYGVLRPNGNSRSTLRLAFEEVLSQGGAASTEPASDDREATPSHTPDAMTSREQEASLQMVACASSIAFETLSIALRRIGDRNVFALANVYLMFVYSLLSKEKAISLLETRIPWEDIARFLTSLAKPETMTSKVSSERFPRPDEGVGRPLPEDFLMRGQLWSEDLFPNTWFVDAAVDDEERILELPSMAAPRVERVLWLGHRIAASGKWMSYEQDSHTFVVSQYVKDFPPQESIQTTQSATPVTSQDSAMSGVQDDEDTSLHIPDSPPLRREASSEFSKSTSKPLSATNEHNRATKKVTPVKSYSITQRKILTKEDVKMTDSTTLKHESPMSPFFQYLNPDSEEWLKREDPDKRLSPQKADADFYASDPRKLDIVTVVDVPEGQDPAKV
ncbi:hypothetical protein MMC26_005820 [Xylographa opegraphella]|nr:hypothetical protein [Xylographa opegraphella]